MVIFHNLVGLSILTALVSANVFLYTQNFIFIFQKLISKSPTETKNQLKYTEPTNESNVNITQMNL